MKGKYLDLGEPGHAEGTWDGLRIGSETCVRLLPEPGRIAAACAGIDPVRKSLVTPLACPDDTGRILDLIDAASSAGWGEIVVNDWGILKEAGRRTDVPLTAGRLLMRLRRGPGEYDRWESLDDRARRYFAWGPLFDSPFLDFLRSNGIGRLEVDAPRHWVPMPEVKDLGLSFHLRTRMVSVSGACPWLCAGEGNRWKEPGECQRECVLFGDLSMEAKALSHPLLLRGKAIIERVEEVPPEGSLPESVDRIILDREDRDRQEK